MNGILIGGGMGILLLAVVLYCLDCRGKPSGTMGGEMLLSALWTLGLIPALLGALPILNLSRWWTVLGLVGLYIASFPFRSLIQRTVCKPYRPEPTGFQKYIRNAERTANQASQVTARKLAEPER